MARQVKNILVGVGTIQLSGELDSNGVPASSLADMGYTIDGVEITMEPDIVDIVVDQLGDAAKLIEQSVKVMIKTTLAEATLANLAIAWGRPDAAYTAGTLGGELKLGVNPTGKPTERQLAFVGKSPEGLDRTYTCWRAVSVASSAHSYKRGEATVFPVEFRILPDGSRTGEEYGVIVDAEA
jgi:hypothetical protein